jgi:hypothetical protein
MPPPSPKDCDEVTPAFSLNPLQPLLAFPFRQRQGTQNLVIGAALLLFSLAVPILPALYVLGYQAVVVRRALRTGELEMPEWTDWSALLVEGLKAFGVSLIYTLPAIAAIVLGYAGMLSTSVMAAIMEDAGPNEVLRLMWVPLLGSLGGIALFGVGMLLALVAGAFAPVALAHMVAAERFAAAFRVREWWVILRANLGGFVLAYVLILGVSMAFSLAVQVLYFTLVLCWLVPVATVFYAMYVWTIGSGLIGLAYRDGVAKLATPLAPPAPALPDPP